MEDLELEVKCTLWNTDEFADGACDEARGNFDLGADSYLPCTDNFYNDVIPDNWNLKYHESVIFACNTIPGKECLEVTGEYEDDDDVETTVKHFNPTKK